MQLAMLSAGQTGIVQQLHGQPKAVKHLEDMGFVAGVTVTVISAINGNMIVEIKGSRLAMNLATASLIIVQS